MSGIWIVFVIGFIAAMAILGHIQAQKRRKELEAWAVAQGLSFTPDKVRDVDSRFPGFEALAKGENRYAHNVMAGLRGGAEFQTFDYHYETHSHDSKGRRQTHHHFFSVVILGAPVPLQPLTIRPEGFFDRIGAFFGYEDINFESAEFSRKFHVSAPDRRWAYDVLHARAIEFLLASPAYSIDMEPAHAMAWRTSRFSLEQFGEAAGLVEGLLARIPDYVKQAQLGPTAPPPLPELLVAAPARAVVPPPLPPS